jgi:membrane-associated phospholipid phosphatase
VPANGWISNLDLAIDRWWERWRGNRHIDRVFFTATNAAEFSLVWHGIGITRALTGRWSWSQAARFSAVMGVESLIVNQGLKRLFRRVRPATAAENSSSHHLRQPITSSFPSGHSSAAVCAAVVLAGPSRARWPIRVVAGLVAISRVHVRLHHPSDVAGGALVGMVLGRLARRCLGRTR